MKNSCPQWDSNPGLSAFKANALSVELLVLRNIDHLKVTAYGHEFFILLLSVRAHHRSSKPLQMK